jgi:hypothetical protein
MMSAGLIDRAIDQWEAAHSRPTVKNTIAALVLDGMEKTGCSQALTRTRTPSPSP